MDHYASVQIKKELIYLRFKQIEVPRMLKFFVEAYKECGPLPSFDIVNTDGDWTVLQPVPTWLHGNENLLVPIFEIYLAPPPEQSLH